MIKELVKDEAILSTPCEPATAADAEIAQDLVETLLSIEDAACLAANQIGVTKAICALADDVGNTLVMYNPKVLFGMGAFKAEESCLTREGSLAANQIGVTKAICALADDVGNTLVMYNPKVLFGMGAFKAEESCLTREGSVRVTRFVKISSSRASATLSSGLPSSSSTCATTARASWFKLPNRQIVPYGHNWTWMLPCSAFCPCSDLLCSSYLKTRTIRPMAVLDGPGFYV